MKKNINVEDIKPEHLNMIENFCSNLDLDDLELDEKIALNAFQNVDYVQYRMRSKFKDYPEPFLKPTSNGAAGALEQNSQILLQTFTLKRIMLLVNKHNRLIEQNDRLINQNQQVIDQNQEIINILKEIKNK